MNILQTLNEMGNFYLKKKPGWVVGDIHISVDEEDFLVRITENNITTDELDDDTLQGDLGLEMSKETFEKLSLGEWNGMTATGRSHMSESAPLDFRLPEGENFEGETMQLLYHFLTHFFSDDHPTVTKLGREHSRKVHGGNAVPIAYGHGVRYAYYTIKKGEQINEDEEDPWEQVFTVMRGTGTAIIDGEMVELKRDMSVHVPPKVDHIIKKEEGDDDLELLWLAYGEKA